MTNEYIDEQMYLLAKHINIGFDNIDWLKKAMNSTPLPKRPDDGKNKITDCENTALATVGDAILKAILSDYFYETDVSDVRKGDITKKKELLEKNDTLFEVMKVADLKQFTYREPLKILKLLQ